MRYTFVIVALVLLHNCQGLSVLGGSGNNSRRLISIPAPIKKAFNSVWTLLKADLKTLGTCMISAAESAAKSLVMGKVPKSAADLLKLFKLRRLGLKGAMKKAAKAVGNAAEAAMCKTMGVGALTACKAAVAVGVKTAAAQIKASIPSLNTSKAQGCMKTFGDSLCQQAYNSVCGKKEE